MESPRTTTSGISIQVSLSGYSFKVREGGEVRSSAWLSADRLFTTPEFQRRYDEVDISLLTPKCTLVPGSFFRPEAVRTLLSDVVSLDPSDATGYVRIPELGAVLLFSNSIGESLSRVLSQTVLTASGAQAPVLPEMYYILKALPACEDYNKVVASYRDGYLHLAVAHHALELAIDRRRADGAALRLKMRADVARGDMPARDGGEIGRDLLPLPGFIGHRNRPFKM
jgi:hypothetical protein